MIRNIFKKININNRSQYLQSPPYVFFKNYKKTYCCYITKRYSSPITMITAIAPIPTTTTSSNNNTMNCWSLPATMGSAVSYVTSTITTTATSLPSIQPPFSIGSGSHDPVRTSCSTGGSEHRTFSTKCNNQIHLHGSNTSIMMKDYYNSNNNNDHDIMNDSKLHVAPENGPNDLHDSNVSHHRERFLLVSLLYKQLNDTIDEMTHLVNVIEDLNVRQRLTLLKSIQLMSSTNRSEIKHVLDTSTTTKIAFKNQLQHMKDLILDLYTTSTQNDTEVPVSNDDGSVQPKQQQQYDEKLKVLEDKINNSIVALEDLNIEKRIVITKTIHLMSSNCRTEIQQLFNESNTTIKEIQHQFRSMKDTTKTFMEQVALDTK